LIDNVLVDGAGNASAKANGSYTFTNVTSDHTLSVSFVPDCLPIVVQVWDDVLSVINIPANNGGHTFVSYQWLKNGVPIPGETSGNLYLANDADRKTMAQYSCRVTTSSNQELEACLGPNVSGPAGVIAYPNPTEGKLTIESSTLTEGDRIEVYSSTGTLVKQVSADSRQTEINLGNLPKGIYVVKVNGEQVKVIRL